VILVDTSVWVNHLKHSNPSLSQRLIDGEVVCHQFVVGELACGGLKNRDEVLGLLKELPQATVVDDGEFHEFVEKQHLWGQGLGFVDVHLLASARVDAIQLWTNDNNLKKMAAKFRLSI
jgi:hypothetical protein